MFISYYKNERAALREFGQYGTSIRRPLQSYRGPMLSQYGPSNAWFMRDLVFGWECPNERHGGLMVSTLVSGSSGPGSSPGLGHCVVFLGKTLYSRSASLHPGV